MHTHTHTHTHEIVIGIVLTLQVVLGEIDIFTTFWGPLIQVHV